MPNKTKLTYSEVADLLRFERANGWERGELVEKAQQALDDAWMTPAMCAVGGCAFCSTDTYAPAAPMPDGQEGGEG